ncbi:hypothetical protein CV657_06190 [Borreliella burgdorferi]|uniref:Uncharacterized protein n=1 Tax=Borreliella burgdorferi 118a TaxID=476210 RepID=A0A7U8EX71_BORBG|nr:hypothetical protein [Borreliella burgdorferi]ACL34331.1 conserved hypothetical protein [Borreliella burgdorferi 156a]EEG98595.1 conserved hypothetical protein [Borreliella burgdorferi 118a]AXK70828.1 hypothetical protein BbuMM1_08280 [Borreliella burgdorferi]PRQ94576.1 hypothetical protein CV682_04320 [Borreliella burgdorferi]PRR00511.1 hypothetical protein CV681_04315 [Borreliella burgdorferi]
MIRRFVLNTDIVKSFLCQCPMPQPKEEILASSLCLTLVKNTSLLIAKNDPLNFYNLLYLEHFEFSKEK